MLFEKIFLHLLKIIAFFSQLASRIGEGGLISISGVIIKDPFYYLRGKKKRRERSDVCDKQCLIREMEVLFGEMKRKKKYIYYILKWGKKLIIFLTH